MNIGERLARVFTRLKLPAIQRVSIQQSIVKEVTQMINETSDSVEMMCVYVLRTKFGFGEKRLNEFVKELNEVQHYYYDRYDLDTVIALKKHLEELDVHIDPVSLERSNAK